MATTPAGSTALVAGATAGIGRASTLQLAGLDAEVAVHGRSAERGAKTVQEIEMPGPRPVSSPPVCPTPTMPGASPRRRGDIPINNAGVQEFGDRRN